jgi:hypothetical protein
MCVSRATWRDDETIQWWWQPRAGKKSGARLGQGCFKVTPDNHQQDVAVNGFNHAGLGLPSDGPTEYPALAARIRVGD